MAVSQIINVIVNSRGAVTVARELDAVGASAKTTATYLNGLRGILAAALTFSGAGQIVETINTFTSLQNKLHQVADAQTSVGDTWTKLIGIADSSYTSISNTVDLYFRVVQAYKAWGQGAKEAAEFTDLFQKAATLSGSSVQTTSQAVYQFGQALNKGKLDGDEFRSVLEGLPYVANIIQKSLGVTRAELYKLSKEGKISVDAIKEAFESSAKTIRADWANITPTIGMALTVLGNSWTDFIGKIETSTGVFSGFAYLILALANNFGLLAIAMAPVVLSFGFLAGRLGLGLLVTGFKDLSEALKLATIAQWLFDAAVAANPYVIALIGIGLLVTAILYFTGLLSGLGPIMTAVWNGVSGLFAALAGYIVTAVSYVANLVASFVEWTGVMTALQTIASITMTAITSMLSAISNAFKGFVAYVGQALKPLFTSLVSLTKTLYDLVKQIVSLYIDSWAPAVTALGVVWKKVWEYIGPSMIKLVGFLSQIYEYWSNIADFLKSNFFPAIKVIFEGWLFLIKSVVDGIIRIIGFLRQAIALLQQFARLGGGSAGGGGAHYGAQFIAGKGFADGGAFQVGGTNSGRDTTPVSFMAERGERVTVETKKQQQQNDKGTAPSVNVGLTSVNVIDPQASLDAMQTASGNRVFVNVIKANRDELRAILGVF
jgi:tape measure domain-containing protein